MGVNRRKTQGRKPRVLVSGDGGRPESTGPPRFSTLLCLNTHALSSLCFARRIRTSTKRCLEASVYKIHNYTAAPFSQAVHVNRFALAGRYAFFAPPFGPSRIAPAHKKVAFWD